MWDKCEEELKTRKPMQPSEAAHVSDMLHPTSSSYVSILSKF